MSTLDVQRFYDFGTGVHAKIELMEMIIAHSTFRQRNIPFLQLIDDVLHDRADVLIFIFHVR